MKKDKHLVRDAKIIHAPVGSEAIVMLSVDAGRYYSVNPVGRRLWELLEQPRTKTELRDAICIEFDVDEPTCEADIEIFVGQMMENGLVHEVDS